MDESEFSAMYSRSVRRIVGVTYATCGNLQEAQDCTQEAFVKAWTHRGRLDGLARPEAWVQVTAVRLAVSRWRRVKAFERAVVRSGPPPTATDAPDGDHVDVVRAMRGLAPRTRAVVALHYLCDQSVQEIADGLDLPANTVKSHLRRGRLSLRADLGQDVDDVAPTTVKEHPHG